MTTTPFWSNDPSILFNKDQSLQLWPQSFMSLEAKLNAISRIIIILSILGFLFTLNLNFLLIGIITLSIMYGLYKKLSKQHIMEEGFTGGQINVIPSKNIPKNNPIKKVGQPCLIKKNFI